MDAGSAPVDELQLRWAQGPGGQVQRALAQVYLGKRLSDKGSGGSRQGDRILILLDKSFEF